MPRIAAGLVLQLARQARFPLYEVAGAGQHALGPASSYLSASGIHAAAADAFLVQAPVHFQPHAASCSCSACTRHAATCSCPACSRHSTSCSCPACRTHGAACSCASCRRSTQFASSVSPYSLQQTRSMACSAGLGRPPPQQVVIEYDPEDVDAYIEVADALEAAFPNIVVLGNEQQKGRKGSFEVTTSDGFQVYSKLQEHQYPNTDELIGRITNRAALNPEVVGSASAEEGRFCT